MKDATIEYENVTKEFGDVKAVNDVSFRVEAGEMLAVLGPSGSGKTTTLRMLAGFETPTRGEIRLDGKNIVDIPAHKRDAGMVFQDYALFPHMSVAKNIKFGLKRRGYSKAEADARVEEVLEMVNLEGFQDRMPTNLSGGQQQRVATARAIAIEPKVLLMDEPLGALDKKLRDQLQVQLSELQSELGITTMYVTHNQQEALTMADRVAVMNEGRIEQIDTPTNIYEQPATEFVADFIGNTNFLSGSLAKQNGTVTLEMDGGEVACNDSSIPEGTASVFVRPEKITVTQPEKRTGHDNSVRGSVDRVLFLGSKIRYYVTVGSQEIVVESENNAAANQFDEGDEVRLNWDRADTQLASS